MKKVIIISLLILLTLGLFVACNADAVATVLQRGSCSYAKFGDISANFKSCGYLFSEEKYILIFSEEQTFSLESVMENPKWSLIVDSSLDGKTINSPSKLISIMSWPDPSLDIKFSDLFDYSSLGASELLEDYPDKSTYTASFKTTKSGNTVKAINISLKGSFIDGTAFEYVYNGPVVEFSYPEV